MHLILTPFADDHGPDTLAGWSGYLQRRGDVPDETVITADALTEAGPVRVAVIYRADPPRCEMVPAEAGHTNLVRDAINEALAAVLGEYDPAKHGPHTHLAQDLRLDSLDMVELSMEIEDRLGIDLSDVDVLTIHTLADLTALVTARVGKTTDMLAESLAAMRAAEEGEDHA